MIRIQYIVNHDNSFYMYFYEDGINIGWCNSKYGFKIHQWYGEHTEKIEKCLKEKNIKIDLNYK